MTVALGIALVVFAALTVVAVLVVFVWAAKKDGEDQEERDRRSGNQPSPYCSAAASCVFANWRCAFAGERFRVSGSSDSIGLPLLVVFGMRR